MSNKEMRLNLSLPANVIYAGHTLECGKMAEGKQDVTTDALFAVAQHVEARGKSAVIDAEGRPMYEIRVRRWSSE